MARFYVYRLATAQTVVGPTVLLNLSAYIGGWITGADVSYDDGSGTPGAGWVQFNMGTAAPGTWDPLGRIADIDFVAGRANGPLMSMRFSDTMVPGLEISAAYPYVQGFQAYAGCSVKCVLTILPPT